MLKLIHRVGSCENGPCPNMFDVTGDGCRDLVAVQGATITSATAAGSIPGVLVPKRLVLEYADLIPGADLLGSGSPPARLVDVAASGPEDMVAVGGEAMTDSAGLAQLSGMPAHESVVLVHRRDVAEYAAWARKETTGDA